MDLHTLSRTARAAGAALLAIALSHVSLGGECLKTDPALYFDLPGGEPATAFIAAHQQGHVDIGYESAESLRGAHLNPVSGRLTLCDALTRMFAGTGLTYELTGPHSIRVRSVTADLRSSPHRSIESTTATSTSVSRLITRDVQPSATHEVVVTGSLIRGVQDISSPLVFIQDEQLEHTPYATVEDAVRTLPLTSRAGPHEQYDPTGTAGNFNGGESINLRGLGPGATLLLVNGRRQPASGYLGDFADASNIPWSAVERIEVLPDGASALYGSDAVAGVVNVILRKDLQGAETQSRLASAPDGARETLFSQSAGTHWEGGKVLFLYQLLKRTPLDASDRSYSASDDKRPLGGTDLRSPLSNPGNILDPATGLPIAAIPAGQSGTPLSVSQLHPGAQNLQNRLADVQLLPDRVTHAFYLSASQALSDRTQLFTESRFTQRSVSQLFPAADAILTVPASNPFFVGPHGPQGYELVGYSFLNDFGPLAGSGRTRAYNATIGLRSEVTDTWQATLATNYGRETMRWFGDGAINYEALETALADPDPTTAFNPFGDGSHSNPHTVESIRDIQHVAATSYVFDTNIIADGRLWSFSAGDAKLAVGADFRREGLTHIAPTPARFGRTVSSAFMELALPLIGPGGSVPKSSPRLSLSVSARSEYYSDFGSTTNPKIGLQWVPSPEFKARLSAGTSFRAPKLVDLYDTSDNAVGVLSATDARAPNGRSIVLVEQGNNPTLREERATTWTAGMDFIPHAIPGLSASLTYYIIDYKNEVFHPGPAVGLDSILSDAQWAPLVTRNPSADQITALCTSPRFYGPSNQCTVSPPSIIVDARLRNLSRTRMNGVDVQLGQLLETGFGQFALRLDGTYLFGFDQAVTQAGPTVSLLNTVGNPLSVRLRGTLDWNQYGLQRPGFGAGLAIDHSGSYRDSSSVPIISVRSSTITDINVHYRTGSGSSWIDNCEVTLNAANVFNAQPPFVNLEIGYDTANSQPVGRVLGLYVRKKW